MGQLYQDTLDQTVRLGDSKLDGYIRTQQMEQLCENTVDGRVM